MGTFANVMMIQNWTALIIILLLTNMTLRSRFGWSLSNFIAYCHALR